MPFIFSRQYRGAPSQMTAAVNAEATEVNSPTTSLQQQQAAATSTAASSFFHNDYTTTRTCHIWSYCDTTRDETVLVTLNAHHSLHVDVGKVVNTGSRNAPVSSSLPSAASSWQSNTSTEDNEEGLCGYSWELTWLPSPSCPRAAPVSARFFYSRTTPLSTSTLRGSGGVLFFSSRHVLIAAERTTIQQVKQASSVASHLPLDSFVLLEQANNSNGTGPTQPFVWHRVAGSVELPCPPSASSSSSSPPVSQRTTSLLVHGVQLQSETLPNKDGYKSLMRVLYVAAIQHAANPSAQHSANSVESVFVGIADLVIASEALQIQANPNLQCVPRHAKTEVQTRPLCLSVPTSTNTITNAPLHSATPPRNQTAVSLQPSDLLWVYVADTERNAQEAARGTQLYGSLLAVLPCLHHRTPVCTEVARQGSSLLPAIPCMGFHATSPYGVLGVTSDALDFLGKEEALRRLSISHAHAGPPSQAVEEVIEQLLPSAERNVYEIEIGRPVEPVQPTASESAYQQRPLPPFASVLMFVFDGLTSRGEAKAAQGLYITHTSSWREAVLGAAAVRRVPLARTLWHGLTPIVPFLATLGNTLSDSNSVSMSSRSRIPAASSNGKLEMDVLFWALTDLDRWEQFLSMSASRTASLAEEGSSAGVFVGNCLIDQQQVEEGDVDTDSEAVGPSPLSATAGPPAASIATVTAVEFFDFNPFATSCCCLPTRNARTHKLTVWYRVSDCARTLESDSVATSPDVATPVAACLPPSCCANTDSEDWEAQVAEWVASRYLLDSSPPTITKSEENSSNEVDTLALTSTLRAIKVLWGCAVLCTTDKRSDTKPAWPQILIDVLRSTTADAAKHQTQLHVYARAVQSLVCERLASSTTTSAAIRREAETMHMRHAAAVFLRLVLRLLIELDWRAGNVQGRLCFTWMSRCFLGETAAAATASVEERVTSSMPDKIESVQLAALVEGRAMQVLLHLGAIAAEDSNDSFTNTPLAWLRRMLLLYTCRCRQRPLELTLSDVVEAAGMSLEESAWQSNGELASRDGWSDEDMIAPGKPAPATTMATPFSHSHVQKGRDEQDLAECRDSMTYALLRMVQPDKLHSTIHQLAFATGGRVVQRSVKSKAGSERLVLHGLLSVADLHELVCLGWTSTQLQETAPLGFTCVGFLVDVAVRATAVTPTNTAEQYEMMVCAALEAWERGEPENALPAPAHDVRVPVYPLLSLCQTKIGHERNEATATMNDSNVPFPFTILPPVLTVYMWHHLVDRLCRALKILPQPPFHVVRDELTFAMSATPASAAAMNDVQQLDEPSLRYGDADDGENDGCEGGHELTMWGWRARIDGAALCRLHRGLCVLRVLVQNDAACAAELFAAMRLVYVPDADDKLGKRRNRKEDVNGGIALWGAQYLAAWQHLLPLEAPPLSNPSAAAAYRDQCLSRGSRFADLIRVLHLAYASAGSGHVLRAQLWRATVGPAKLEPNSRNGDCKAIHEHTCSLVQAERSLQAWLSAATTVDQVCTTTTTANTPTANSISTDSIASWLVQVWTHVLLCDSTAVTDIGLYEHVYAALAHVKQKLWSASSPHAQSDALTQRAADVAFAVLRPFCMYAYPLLLELAVAEEVMSGPPDCRYVSPSQQQSGWCAQKKKDRGCEEQGFLQFNEPLVWQVGTTHILKNNAAQRHRALEQLCAGEVCERARRQLGRVVGLYEAQTSTNPESNISGSGDRRFHLLASLLSLVPSSVDIARRQRRLLRSLADNQQQQQQSGQPGGITNTPSSNINVEQTSIARLPPDSHATSIPNELFNSGSSSSTSTRHADLDVEGMLELVDFYLSPMVAYVAAASAFVIRSNDEGSSNAPSSVEPPREQQQQQSSFQHLGWFTVVCEAMRRELRAYVVAELLLAGCIASLNDASTATATESKVWRLVATERELKAFINALADAVMPLTQALANGLRFPLYRFLVLALVFDILHQFFFEEEKQESSHRDDAAGGPARFSCHTSIRADAPRLQLVKQWIRQVVAPLHSSLSAVDQRTIAHVMSHAFVTEYFGDAAERKPTTSPQQHPNTQGAPQTEIVSAYTESTLHRTWQQWRKQEGGRLTFGTQVNPKAEAAMLACLRHCIANGYQHVLHVSPPLCTSAGAATPTVDVATQELKEGLDKEGTSGVQVSASWIEAGNALRSSLMQTIGAKVAPRALRHARSASSASASASSTGVPTPQPASVVMIKEEKYNRPNVSASTLPPEISSSAAPKVSGTMPITLQMSCDFEEVFQLLNKEELFVRRQLSRQLFGEQQQSFFASSAFQQSLIRLYLAMRAERRRKELVDFALDQHDLIFAFVSREQQLVHGLCRRALRQAWVDYGERQRLALRCLLQEERDARTGIQATAYADHSFLRYAEQAERIVWMLEEEGRRGLELLEVDARDVLRVAAAQVQVEMARRAVESEEAAYWKAEEEAWARIRDMEAAVGVTASYSSSAGAKKPVDEELSAPMTSALSAESRFVLPLVVPHQMQCPPVIPLTVSGSATVATAAAMTTVSSQRSPEASPPLQPATKPLVNAVRASSSSSTQLRAKKNPAQEPAKGHCSQAGSTHAVAQAAAEVGTSSLFGTLSRWQTALREAVAPAPPLRKTKLTEHTESAAASGEVLIPPLPPPQPRVTSKISPVETAVDVIKIENDDDEVWSWGSESSSEEVREVVPVKPGVVAKAAKARDSQKRASLLPTAQPLVVPLHTHQIMPPVRLGKVRLMVDTTDRRILPLQKHAGDHAASSKPVIATTTVGAQTGSGKPVHSKKGLAASLLVEPISSTAAVRPTHPPSITSLLPMTASTAAAPPPPHHAMETTCFLSCPEDTTPNPARSILSAVEAAATETISKVRRAAAAGVTSPTSAQSASEDDVGGTSAMIADDPHTPIPPPRPVLSAAQQRKNMVGKVAAQVEGGSRGNDICHRNISSDVKEVTTDALPATVSVSRTEAPQAHRVAAVAVADTEEVSTDNGWNWSDDSEDEDDTDSLPVLLNKVERPPASATAATTTTMQPLPAQHTLPFAEEKKGGNAKAFLQPPQGTELQSSVAQGVQPTVRATLLQCTLPTDSANSAPVVEEADNGGWDWSDDEVGHAECGDVVVPAQTQFKGQPYEALAKSPVRADVTSSLLVEALATTSANKVVEIRKAQSINLRERDESFAQMTTSAELSEAAVIAAAVAAPIGHDLGYENNDDDGRGWSNCDNGKGVAEPVQTQESLAADKPEEDTVQTGSKGVLSSPRNEDTTEEGQPPLSLSDVAAQAAVPIMGAAAASKVQKSDDEAGWGWSDDEEEGTQNVASTPRAVDSSLHHDSIAHTGKEGAAALVVPSTAVASADEPTPGSVATALSAPLAEKYQKTNAGSSDQSDADKIDAADLLESDTVSLQRPMPAAPPHCMSTNTRGFSGSDVQQLYLKELKMREQLLNYL